MSGMVVYSASELGACTKYLVAKRLGYDAIPEYGKGIPAFEQGHKIEAEVIEWLKNSGYTITDQQTELYLSMGVNEEGDNVVIRCHPDALGITPDGQEVVIEIKSAQDDAYSDFKRNGWDGARGLFPRYKYQVSSYHHVTGRPVLFVIRNKEFNVDGEPIKTRGGVGKTLVHLTDSRDLYTREELKKRVDRIEAMAAQYDIPEACDYPNYLCPVTYLHEEQHEMIPNATIDELCREYVQVRDAVKKEKDSGSARRLNIRNRIMKEIGLDPYTPGESMVVDTGFSKVRAIYGATGYPAPDWEKMREDGIDTKKYQKKPRMGWRVNIYLRGEKKGVDNE